MCSITKEPAHAGITQLSRPRDVFFFAHVRTASHVLCRLLSKQPGWIQSDYHFFDAFNHARDTFGWRSLDTVPKAQLQDFTTLLQNGFDEIQRERQCAMAANKALLLKEHTFYIWDPSELSRSMWGGCSTPCFTVEDTMSLPAVSGPLEGKKTNPTIFSDAFLKSWRPLFLVRHPALTFESWYRAESGARPVDIFDKSWAFYTTFQYQRQLYDWLLSNETDSGSMPIVLDADDMMDKSSTIEKLCGLLGMDPKQVLREWDDMQPSGYANRRQFNFMSGYWGSTCVDSSKSSRGLDLAVKYASWRHEFGDVVAAELQRLVDKAIPDYEYLKSRRI